MLLACIAKKCGKELASGMYFCVSCGEPIEVDSEEKEGSTGLQDDSKEEKSDFEDSQDEHGDEEPVSKEPQDESQEQEPEQDLMPETKPEPSPEPRSEPDPDSEPEPEPEQDRMPEAIEQDRMTYSPQQEAVVVSQGEPGSQEAPMNDTQPSKKRNSSLIFMGAALALLLVAIIVAVVVMRPSQNGSAEIKATVSSTGSNSQSNSDDGAAAADKAKQETEAKAKQEAEAKAKQEAEEAERAKQEAEAAAKAEEEARAAEQAKKDQAVSDAVSRGQKVFEGTIMVGTFEDIANYEGGQSLTSYNIFGRQPSDRAAIIILDAPENVALEGFGSSVNEEVDHFSLAIEDSGIHYRWPYDGAVDQWEQYDGTHVTVAGSPLMPAGETFPHCPQLNNAEFLYTE